MQVPTALIMILAAFSITPTNAKGLREKSECVLFHPRLVTDGQILHRPAKLVLQSSHCEYV